MHLFTLQWAKGLCNCWQNNAGLKSFGMACCWPCCGPCLYSKISARSAQQGTSWEKLGDTPFKQWFRITVNVLISRCLLPLTHHRISSSAGDSYCRDQPNNSHLPYVFFNFSQLILVLIYWFASWGESMMAPEKPHFNAIANSNAELKDLKSMDNFTESAVVRAFFYIYAVFAPNLTCSVQCRFD